jgi:hypothetical protein
LLNFAPALLTGSSEQSVCPRVSIIIFNYQLTGSASAYPNGIRNMKQMTELQAAKVKRLRLKDKDDSSDLSSQLEELEASFALIDSTPRPRVGSFSSYEDRETLSKNRSFSGTSSFYKGETLRQRDLVKEEELRATEKVKKDWKSSLAEIKEDVSNLVGKVIHRQAPSKPVPPLRPKRTAQNRAEVSRMQGKLMLLGDDLLRLVERERP